MCTAEKIAAWRRKNKELRSKNFSLGALPSDIPLACKNTITAIGTMSDKWLHFLGPIPSSFSTLNKLTKLYLAGRRLIGPMPDWLGELKRLKMLHLGANLLSGTVPASIGNLVDLTELKLYQNQMIGPVPVSFS